MSLEINLSIFLIENRLIRDFLYLEMYKAHGQAGAVRGDHARARDLIQLVQLLQDVIGLFRDNTCIIDGLNVLNRVGEFFTDDFPMILTFENMYRDVLDVIHNYKRRNRLLEPPVPVGGPLPAIGGLTRFDGRLIEWRYFHVNFITYVHSIGTLGHEVRFNYLLSLLSGDALHVVRGFPPFAENYIAAWTTLQYHYENTYVLGLSHLEAIYNSREPCPDLRTFADAFKENVARLRAIWQGDLERIVEFYADSRLSLSSMSFNNVQPRGGRVNLKWLKDFVGLGCRSADDAGRVQGVPPGTCESDTGTDRRARAAANTCAPTATASPPAPSTGSAASPRAGRTPKATPPALL